MSREPLYRIVYSDGHVGIPLDWSSLLEWTRLGLYRYRRFGEARPVGVKRA